MLRERLPGSPGAAPTEAATPKAAEAAPAEAASTGASPKSARRAPDKDVPVSPTPLASIPVTGVATRSEYEVGNDGDDKEKGFPAVVIA